MAEIIQERKPHTVDRLLRCRKTHNYFSGSGWTEDGSRAAVFESELDAARACVVHGLNNVDLVLRTTGTEVVLFATQLR